LAFDEKVGVLDGNVIRILTRRFGLKINWWETQSKQYLQNISDALAFTSESADMNQAMMELGATICTPKKTMCLLCPWKKECKAFEKNEIEILPLKKAKDDLEIWQWNFYPEIKKNKILLYENKSTPFLKNTWLPYSTAKKIGSKPKVFSFKHSVTKYEIFINLKKEDPKNKISKGQLVEFDKISQINPTSLIKKIMSHLETL
jgi:A/G-specific adenine glycosylase